MKSACKLDTPEDRVRYNECTHILPPISRASLLIITGVLAGVFFLDWAIWGGNLIGDGKFYLDDFLPSLPHLRIHHYHDGIFLLLVAGGIWILWMRHRADWCCGTARWVSPIAIAFYACVITAIFLIVRDFSDVLLWWETGNFFPDPL